MEREEASSITVARIAAGNFKTNDGRRDSTKIFGMIMYGKGRPSII
jgi:hypothetical protein